MKKNSNKSKVIRKSIKGTTPVSSEGPKWYVAYQEEESLYYFVLTDNKDSFNCWTLHPNKASALTAQQAKEAVEIGKQNNLTDTWIVAPFSSLFKNVLQNIYNTLGFHDNQPFDIIEMKEKINNLIEKQISFKLQTKKIEEFRSAFNFLMDDNEIDFE